MLKSSTWAPRREKSSIRKKLPHKFPRTPPLEILPKTPSQGHGFEISCLNKQAVWNPASVDLQILGMLLQELACELDGMTLLFWHDFLWLGFNHNVGSYP